MSGLGIAGGALTAGAGAGIGMLANSKNAKNQSAQAAESAATQANYQKQASQAVSDEATRAAGANPGAGRNDLLTAYHSALNAGAPAAAAALPTVSGANARYAKGVASAKANVSDYARTMADNMATTGGAQLQRLQTGEDIANTASKLGLINGQSMGAANVLKTQLAGDQANPWLLALGKAAGSAGQAMIGNGVAKGFAPSASPGVGSSDFTGVDSSGAPTGASFMGDPATPAYSTGFNKVGASSTVGGYSNPFL